MAVLTGWQYRKKITISGSTGAGTNYQVLLKVGESSGSTGANFDLGGHSANFPSGTNQGGDLMFTASDGITLLNFWVESVSGTAPNRVANIWVKVSADLGTNQDIYCYYGNPSATNYSNPDTTFVYYDDGNKYSGWTQGTTAVVNDTSDGNPAPSYKAQSTSGTYMYKNVGLAPNMLISYNTKTTGLGNLFFLVNSSGAGQMYRIETRGGVYSGFATTSSWTSWNAPSSGPTLSTNTWYKFIIALSSTQASLYYAQTTSYSPIVSGTLIGTYTFTNNGGYIGLVGDALGSTYYTWWDNLIIRKYVSPEPTFSSVGPEETIFYEQQRPTTILSVLSETERTIDYEGQRPTTILSVLAETDKTIDYEGQRPTTIISVLAETDRRIDYEQQKSVIINTLSSAQSWINSSKNLIKLIKAEPINFTIRKKT